MNDVIINGIVNDLNIKKESVVATLKLLEEGNTVPFIARYRKEVTGALNEEEIRSINEVYEYQENLLKRKEDVIRLIDEKGMLTPKLFVIFSSPTITIIIYQRYFYKSLVYFYN